MPLRAGASLSLVNNALRQINNPSYALIVANVQGDNNKAIAILEHEGTTFCDLPDWIKCLIPVEYANTSKYKEKRRAAINELDRRAVKEARAARTSAPVSTVAAPVLVPPPTPGASTAAVVPSTPSTPAFAVAPSTPADLSTILAIQETAAKERLQMQRDMMAAAQKAEEDRKEREEREAKREDRDAKREAKRDEEFDKLASATKIAMETGTLALTTANQANQKGDFVIKEIEKTNKKVDRLEKFEEFVMKGRGKQLFRLNGDMSNDSEAESDDGSVMYVPLPPTTKTNNSGDEASTTESESEDEADDARSFVADEDDDTPSQDSEEDPQKNTTSDETGDDPQGKRKSNDAAVELNSLTPSNEDAVNEIVDASTKATVPSKMSFFKDWALSFIDFLVDDSSFSGFDFLIAAFIFGAIFGVIFGAIVALVALAVGFPFASSALVISWSILCAILGGSIFVYWL